MYSTQVTTMAYFTRRCHLGTDSGHGGQYGTMLKDGGVHSACTQHRDDDDWTDGWIGHKVGGGHLGCENGGDHHGFPGTVADGVVSPSKHSRTASKNS